jgi:hypothetical protein
VKPFHLPVGIEKADESQGNADEGLAKMEVAAEYLGNEQCADGVVCQITKFICSPAALFGGKHWKVCILQFCLQHSRMA